MPRRLGLQGRGTTALILLALLPASAIARGGHGGGGHGGYGGLGHGSMSSSALTAPAAPSVPPSLTPDARLTGQAPLPPAHAGGGGPTKGFQAALDPEDAKVDKMIKNICKGC